MIILYILIGVELLFHIGKLEVNEMKPRSGKNKGQRLQKDVVNRLRGHYGFDLYENSDFEGDIQANPMGNSGIDIKLSPLAQKDIPYDIECKNTEKLNVWAAIEQAEANAKEGRIPLVIFKRNRSKTYAIIELDDLLEVN